MSIRIKSLSQLVYKRRSYRAPQSPLSSIRSSSLSTHQQTLTLLNPHSPFSSSYSSSSSCYYNHHAFHVGFSIPSKPTSSFPLRYLSTTTTTTTTPQDIDDQNQETPLEHEMDDEVEPIDLWEEEDDAEPEIGDGGDGGGVVLQNCPWGERALSIAHEILLQFGDDMKLYAFKTTPRGYIYVRLDKLSNEYGCPGMEEIESYSHQYKKRLDEVGALGEIPDDLALEVSSPSAERLLKVPDDMNRFKDMPMRVSYVEDLESKCPEKNGVFYLDSIKTESGSCVWRLADVKENRDPSAKGRLLSRKQKDWRLELPYAMFKKVTLFLDY
ncbi:Ribosome maturation factor RimP [Camellia lanceoleosa]|uniref:Ribosome maturation factor RimP n=1 Tax=Camellia lanceoleosa TaxID=1840588 RepID=A0ACC0FYH1_9ERIC|nr:Ribosome maturation factor RimP [Camellia lanceoleosa]